MNGDPEEGWFLPGYAINSTVRLDELKRTGWEVVTRTSAGVLLRRAVPSHWEMTATSTDVVVGIVSGSLGWMIGVLFAMMFFR